MGIIHTITEGGQIWTHRFRMFRQVIKVTLGVSFLIGLFVFSIYMLAIPMIYCKGAWYFSKGYLLENYKRDMEVDNDYWQKITGQRSTKENITVPTKYVMKVSERYALAFLDYCLAGIKIAGFFSNICLGVSLLFFLIFGRRSKAKQQLSGKKISKSWLLNLKLKLTRKASPLHIGSTPLVKGTESQHLLITGGTGTGKTNCLHHILKQIRQLDQKAIIVDTTGMFVDRYYSPGKDVILSPFNKLSEKWHPWAECKNQSDYNEIAEAFIPHSNSEHDNYWRQASRTLFSSILQKLKESKKNSELVQWLLFESLANVCELMKGTKAASHMDIHSEKTASSVRSVASTFLECLECLEDTMTSFSIREWVASPNQNSWLFLQCTQAERSTVRPLLSAWISSAIRGILALEPDLNRKIWFVIDELPSLQKVKDIEVLLTEGRKYGACGILSLQSPAQL
ncbi:MAG: type IV secretion system DNA-binding domain-containing protein, partial [Chlamydiales bacterium]